MDLMQIQKLLRYGGNPFDPWILFMIACFIALWQICIVGVWSLWTLLSFRRFSSRSPWPLRYQPSSSSLMVQRPKLFLKEWVVKEYWHFLLARRREYRSVLSSVNKQGQVSCFRKRTCSKHPGADNLQNAFCPLTFQTWAVGRVAIC